MVKAYYGSVSSGTTPDVVLALTFGNPSAAIFQRQQLDGLLRRDASRQHAYVSPYVMLAVDRSTCKPSLAPCAFSASRFAAYQGSERALRLRVHYLYRFFCAGANVIQLDSDISLLRSPFELLQGELAGNGAVGQTDSPILNCGFVAVRHINASSDAAVRWMLGEWNNRMIRLSREGTTENAVHGNNVAEQAIINDVLETMGLRLPRYTLFHVVEARNEAQSRPDGNVSLVKQQERIFRTAAEKQFWNESRVWHRGLLRSFVIEPPPQRSEGEYLRVDPLARDIGALTPLVPPMSRVRTNSMRDWVELSGDAEMLDGARSDYAMASDDLVTVMTRRTVGRRRIAGQKAEHPDECEPYAGLHLCTLNPRHLRPLILAILAHRREERTRSALDEPPGAVAAHVDEVVEQREAPRSPEQQGSWRRMEQVTPLIQLDVAGTTWRGELLRRPKLFEGLMAMLAELTLTMGRKMLLPRLPPDLLEWESWHKLEVATDGVPPYISSGCRNTGDYRVHWIPFSLVHECNELALSVLFRSGNHTGARWLVDGHTDLRALPAPVAVELDLSQERNASGSWSAWAASLPREAREAPVIALSVANFTQSVLDAWASAATPKARFERAPGITSCRVWL